ncbi:HWE histidine kinase domain-containing protein [Phenylobacterium sp. LjRoot225]|uniref:PAS domain-containing sensor histidine kinase n=1 Tax=Phenylobacterium sp. LjRoot225 TaxID=3342285 RepID=UPI003F5010B4
MNEAAFLRGGGETGELIAKHDWASTPLGPLSAWPQSLKTATGILLRSPVPMALHWGLDGVTIYNDAFAAMVGARHPQLLGAKVREGLREFADLSDQAITTALAGGALTFQDLELTSYRSGKPRQVWVKLDYSPVLDESGRPAGVLAIVADTTERVLAERKAGARAEQERRMFEQAPGFIRLTRGPDHIFEFANEAYMRLIGKRNIIGKPHREVFADTLEHAHSEILDHVYATGERYVARAQPAPLKRSPEGPEEVRFIDYIMQSVTGEDGKVTGVFVEGFDVTERVRAQAAVEESNRRLNAAAARLGVFELDLETRQATFNARAREILGFGPDESLTIDDLIRRIDSNEFERLRAQATAAEAAGEARREREYRIHLPDGSIRDVISVSDHSPGPNGRPTRVVGVVDDVTERRRAERRQQLLINELNHRVKNTLATVQSIAAQTLRSASNLTSAREVFEARLVALAAAHDLLTAESWRGARLTDVAATAMAPFETTQRPQIVRFGPPVWLTAYRALALSLALHELAANAAKYGALSVPEGRVTIRWSVCGDELRLFWIEEGGPPVAAPSHSGFGTRLLQRSLAHELHGEVAFTFAPEGVRCEIRCEVEDVRAWAAEIGEA